MEDKDNDRFYETIVEIDETYIGGKPRKGNRKDDDRPSDLKRGWGTKKVPIVAVIDRKERKVFAKVALANSRGQKLTGIYQ